LRVISADSAAAILDPQFKPQHLIASVSVLINPPYREPVFRLTEPIFREVESGFEVIVHEAELCRSLLDKMKADVVHLDLTLGGVSIEELSPIELTNLRASRTGRQNILKILPRLRKIAGEIKIWALGLISQEWILEILRLKTVDGHCYTHKSKTGKPCPNGSQFHKELYEICQKSFKEASERPL
jgi:hypothetical protein